MPVNAGIFYLLMATKRMHGKPNTNLNCHEGRMHGKPNTNINCHGCINKNLCIRGNIWSNQMPLPISIRAFVAITGRTKHNLNKYSCISWQSNQYFEIFLSSLSMKTLIAKHSLAVRIFHWINFPVIFIMIWSGTLIYWANDVYKITLANHTIFKFYPKSVYATLNIPYRLAEGMSWHFVFMWLFFLNGLLYVVYLIFSGEWKDLIPKLSSFRDAWYVFLYDLRLRKIKPEQGKYNAAQKVAYSVIVLMGAGSLITGLVIYKPVEFSLLTSILGGYEAARLEHFILTILFLLFFLVHIIQVIFAGWNNFRAIITGWEIQKVNSIKDEKDGK
jgi:thiosulfate reductase cytochrome b subunit